MDIICQVLFMLQTLGGTTNLYQPRNCSRETFVKNAGLCDENEGERVRKKCSTMRRLAGVNVNAPNAVSNKDKGSKRHSLQAVELSQWFQPAVQIVSNLPAPSIGGPIYRFFGHAGHADPLDSWRCCSQKRVMSKPIQVRQL